jgi:hypothetical protein
MASADVVNLHARGQYLSPLRRAQWAPECLRCKRHGRFQAFLTAMIRQDCGGLCRPAALGLFPLYTRKCQFRTHLNSRRAYAAVISALNVRPPKPPISPDFSIPESRRAFTHHVLAGFLRGCRSFGLVLCTVDHYTEKKGRMSRRFGDSNLFLMLPIQPPHLPVKEPAAGFSARLRRQLLGLPTTT